MDSPTCSKIVAGKSDTPTNPADESRSDVDISLNETQTTSNTNLCKDSTATEEKKVPDKANEDTSKESRTITETPRPFQTTSQQGKTVYGKELRCMMYGFGDDKNPYTESVDVLEELVFKYIKETTTKAIDIKRNGKITVDDIMYLIRKDKRKCDRVKDLLLMNEELKRSRKAFDLESLATHKNM